MIKCNNCGAQVGPTDEACRYCKATTAHGTQIAQQRKHQEQQQQHWQQQARFQQDQHKQYRAGASVRGNATNALIWAVGGMVVCCFPASIVGLVLSLRVRKVAREHGLLIPGQATVALVLAIIGLLVSGAAVASYLVDERQLESARAALQEKVEKSAGKKRLSHATACAIVELELLENGYLGGEGMSIDSFKCSGKLKRKGDLAQIERVRFKANSAAIERSACLIRGARWDFLDFRELDESCKGKTRAQQAKELAASAAAKTSSAASTASSAAVTPSSTASSTASAAPKTSSSSH